MHYNYHVDVTCDYGDHEVTRTYKVDTFGEAFELFTDKVEICRARKNVLAWSVSIYDADVMRLKLSLNDIDFE